MDNQPKKTFNIANTRVYRAYKPIDDRLVHELELVITGNKPNHIISKVAAEELHAFFEHLEEEILSLATAHSLFMVAAMKMGDLVRDNVLDNITSKVFPPQEKAMKEIFQLADTMSNYYTKKNEQTNQKGVDKANNEQPSHS